MGKSKAPKAPDYKGAAEATAASNQQSLEWQTQANRPDIYTPWGSETWSRDANNNWTQSIQLSPDQQAALASQQEIQNKQSELAGGLRDKVASTFSKDFNAPQLSTYTNGLPSINSNFSGFNDGSQINLNAPKFNQDYADKATQAAYDKQMALIRPQQMQDTKRMDETLRLQGLQPGTEAYNNAAQNLSRTQDQQTSQAANDAILTGSEIANRNYASELAGYGAGNDAIGQQFGQALAGYGANQQAQQAGNQSAAQSYDIAKDRYATEYAAALQQYQQPLNNFNAVLTGQQVQQPVFNGPNTTAGNAGGVDYLGAAQQTGQYNSGLVAAQNAAAGSTIGGIATLGAAFL